MPVISNIPLRHHGIVLFVMGHHAPNTLFRLYHGILVLSDFLNSRKVPLHGPFIDECHLETLCLHKLVVVGFRIAELSVMC